ncbi:hypothetical protein QP405_05835 [Gleimia europaea]|nr:hypothetical protein [Gleimia europaea]MDK7143379.1 hypothetical protein [Gleimia europaea]
MASEIIGKISIRVYPDTSRFYEETKAKLESIARRLDQEVELEPRVSKAAKARAKKDLADIEAEARVVLERASIKEANALAKRQLHDQAINVRVKYDNVKSELAARRMRSVTKAMRDMADASNGLDRQYRTLTADQARLQREAKRYATTLTQVKDSWGRVINQMDTAHTKTKNMWGDTYLNQRSKEHFNNFADSLERAHTASARAQRGVNNLHKSIRALADEQERVKRERSFAYKLDKASERALRRMRALAKHWEPLEIPVELTERSVLKVKHKLRDLQEKRKVTLEADLDHGMASAKLAAVTRPRFVKIKAIIDKKSWGLVWKTLTRMSGLRAGWHYMRKFWDFFKDLDKRVPLIGLIGEGIMGLTAVLSHSIGATFTFIGSLSRIAGLVNVLPGFLGAAAFGFTTFFLSMKHAGDYVGDLREKFTALRVTITDSFWQSAEQPLRNVVDTLLPRLDARMGQSAEYMGRVFGAAITQLNQSLTDSQITALFDNLDESLHRIAPGIAALIDALTVMGVKGSEYLVRFSDWFTDGMENFRDHMRKAVEDGSFDRWLEQAIDSSKLFGRALKGTYKVFEGLTKAARKAGHSGLETYVKGMERVGEYLNSVAGNDKVARFFRNARLAADDAYQGISNLLHAFGDIDDTIGRVMRTSGRTLNDFFSGIGDMIRHPAFTAGLEAMFTGIEKGVAVITEHSAEFAEFFGSLGEIIGTFAEILGPVAATLVEAMAPALSQLADTFERLKPTIVDLIEGPILSGLEALFGFIGAHPGAVLAMAAAVTTASVAFKGLRFLGNVSSWVEGLGGLAGGMRGIAGSLGGGLAGKVTGFAGSLGLLSKVARGAGYIGLAAGAVELLTAAMRKSDEFFHDNTHSVDEWSEKIAKAKDATELFKDASYGLFGGIDLIPNNAEFQRLLDKISDDSFWNQTWLTIDKGIARIGGSGQLATTAFLDQLKQIDEALAGMDVEPAMENFRKLAASTDGSEQSMSRLLDSLPNLKEQLAQYAASLGLPVDDSTLLKIATGEIKIAFDEMGNAIITAGNKFDPMTTQVESSVNILKDIFGENVNLPEPLAKAFESLQQTATEQLQITEEEMQARLPQILAIMQQEGYQTSQAWADIMEGIPLETRMRLEANRDQIIAGLDQAVLATSEGAQGIKDELQKGFDFDATEQCVVEGMERIGTAVVENSEPLKAALDDVWYESDINTRSFFENLRYTVSTKMGEIRDQWNADWANIGQTLAAEMEFTWGKLTTNMGKIRDHISAKMGEIGALWEAGWGRVSDFVSTAWDNIKRGVSDGVSRMIQVVSGVPGKVVSAIGDLGGLLYSAGQSVLSGFIDGINSMIGSVRSALQWVTDMLPSWKGPAGVDAKILYNSGVLVMSGFQRGLERQYGAIKRSLKAFTSDLSPEREAVRLAAGAQAAFDSVNPRFDGVERSTGSISKAAGARRARLRLVVDDRREFNAHMETIADGRALRLMEELAL